MRAILFAAFAACIATPAFAADARATGNLPIRSGPGDFYRVIGTLPDNTSVGLSRCTRQSIWCKIVYDEGPDGWVLGSYLVGSAAKMHATPSEFTNPFRMFN